MKKVKKILIIEDDSMISSMYKTKLKQSGFDVLIADNGVTGVEMAVNEKPDLIMLDIILPQLDGFSVLDELRNKKNIKVSIIMLTNLGTEEDIEKGKKLGATDYLIKSNLTPAEISEIIKKYL